MSQQVPNSVVIDAVSDAPVLLPDDPGYLTADYVREGDDLVIETPSGEVTVISDYFALEAPVDLIVAGATISGKVVGALARPRREAEAGDAETAETAPAAGAHASETASTEIGEPIGQIGEISGEAFAKRADGSVVALKAGDPVYEDDLLSTGDGAALGVVFTDGMTFSLGAHARMVLDEFRYDAAAEEGGGLFSVLAGEFSFVSGAAAHTAEDALMIETPTMTIGVRGTRVVSQIDADGVSRIALLAEEDGTVGKIMVMTDAGAQLMDAPNTMVEIADRSQPPSAQKDITATDVVRFFGEAVDALPAPHAFFEPKLNAPNAAPPSPFADVNRARAEAEEGALEVEVAIADAAAETSFAQRAQTIAEQTAPGPGADAPAADFTLVARRLRQLAEETAATEPEAFIQAVEEQQSPRDVVEQALQSAFEIAEAATEAAEAAAAEAAKTAADELEARLDAATPQIIETGAAVDVAEGVAAGAVIYSAGEDGFFNYTLENDQGGLFTVDAETGDVAVAPGRALDFETAADYTLIVQSTNGAGAASRQTIALTVTDENEFAVSAIADDDGAANMVTENARDGDAVGVSASAQDADGSNNTVSFSLSDDAGGRFAIDAATGVVTIADASLLDYETTAQHLIEITANGADGSLSTATFTVNISDAAEAIQLADEGGVFVEFGVTEASVTGGAGADMIFGAQGADMLFGGGGNDAIYGSAGADAIHGGADNDGGFSVTPQTFNVAGVDIDIAALDARGAVVMAPSNDGISAPGGPRNVTWNDRLPNGDGILRLNNGADQEAIWTISQNGVPGFEPITVTIPAGQQAVVNVGNVVSGSAFVITAEDGCGAAAPGGVATPGDGFVSLKGGATFFDGDILFGGAGNDLIDGGAGSDAALFSGDYADYAFTHDAQTGVFTVDGPDGLDTVTNVEFFYFDDQAVAAATVIADLSAPTISAAAAIGFDGVDDWVSAVETADPNATLNPGTGDLTVEAWFYYDGSALGDQTILSKGNEAASLTGYSIRLVDDALVLRLNADETADAGANAAVSQALSGAGWRHVAMVIDQTAGTLTGYLNGSPAGFAPGFAGDGITSDSFDPPADGIEPTDSLSMGANFEDGGSSDFFEGLVSDVRVWSSARSQAEISATLNRSLDGTESGLLAQWAPSAGDTSLVDDAGALVTSLLGGAQITDPTTVALSAEGAATGRFVLSDPDGDALTVSSITAPTKGEVAFDHSTGVWTYFVANDDDTSDSFSYQVSDGDGGVDTVSITINLAA